MRGDGGTRCTTQQRHILYRSDEPILDLLPPEPAPTRTLEVMLVRSLSKAAFHEVAAPPVRLRFGQAREGECDLEFGFFPIGELPSDPVYSWFTRGAARTWRKYFCPPRSRSFLGACGSDAV